MRVLHLGCGKSKRAGAIGADLNRHSNADVICDLDGVGFPFADNQFDLVICEHVLEHLKHLIRAIEEIHRVAKPHARVYVQVPHFSSVHFYSDPTHEHAFGLHTFDYFIRGTAVRDFEYSKAEFQLLRASFPPPMNAGWLKRTAYVLINRYKDWYEKHLVFVLPRHSLEFELQVIKPAQPGDASGNGHIPSSD